MTPLAASIVPFPALIELLQLETCTTAGLTTTCPLGDMLPGDVVTLRFTGRVPAGAADGTVFTDTASITATGDTVPANNVDVADVTVDAAIGEPPPPPPGPGEGPGAGAGPGAAPAPGTADSPGRSGRLPVTGLALAALVLAGLVLLGTGTAARVVAHARRQHPRLTHARRDP